MIVYEDDALKIVWQSGDSDFLLISFGDLITSTEGEEFFARRPAINLRLNCLGFVSKKHDWYTGGSVAIGWHAAQQHAARFPVRILHGCSMGGYAALKFGSLMGATAALVYCPQWSLDPAECDGFDPGWSSFFRPSMRGHGGPARRHARPCPPSRRSRRRRGPATCGRNPPSQRCRDTPIPCRVRATTSRRSWPGPKTSDWRSRPCSRTIATSSGASRAQRAVAVTCGSEISWKGSGSLIRSGPRTSFCDVPTTGTSARFARDLLRPLVFELERRGTFHLCRQLLDGFRDDVAPQGRIRLLAGLAAASGQDRLHAGLQRRPPRLRPGEAGRAATSATKCADASPPAISGSGCTCTATAWALTVGGAGLHFDIAVRDGDGHLVDVLEPGTGSATWSIEHASGGVFAFAQRERLLMRRAGRGRSPATVRTRPSGRAFV